MSVAFSLISAIKNVTSCATYSPKVEEKSLPEVQLFNWANSSFNFAKILDCFSEE